MALLPAYELVLLHVLPLSHDQLLVEDQVTSLVEEPLERLDELAAPEVPLLQLSAQRENG